jgi:hypothetical protein
MSRAVMVVFTHPASPDVEDQYNDWYDNVHLKDLLAVPGVVGTTRYRLSPTQPAVGTAGPSAAPYLAVYEIEADDPSVTLGEIGKRAGTEKMRMSKALGHVGEAAPRAIVYNLID